MSEWRGLPALLNYGKIRRLSERTSEGYTCTHHNIQPPKLLNCNLHSTLHLLLLTHIRLNSHSLRVRVFLHQELAGFFCGVDVHVDEDDGGALRREEDGGLEADAAVVVG